MSHIPESYVRGNRTQQSDIDMDHTQQSNADMDHTQQSNTDMDHTQQSNAHTNHTQHSNAHTNHTQQSNANMDHAQQSTDHVDLTQESDDDMDYTQQFDVHINHTRQSDAHMDRTQHSDVRTDHTKQSNAKMDDIQQPNANMNQAQQPKAIIDHARRPNANMNHNQQPSADMNALHLTNQVQQSNGNMYPEPDPIVVDLLMKLEEWHENLRADTGDFEAYRARSSEVERMQNAIKKQWDLEVEAAAKRGERRALATEAQSKAAVIRQSNRDSDYHLLRDAAAAVSAMPSRQVNAGPSAVKTILLAALNLMEELKSRDKALAADMVVHDVLLCCTRLIRRVIASSYATVRLNSVM